MATLRCRSLLPVLIPIIVLAECTSGTSVSIDGLYLNGGYKWPVNEATIVGLDEMKNAIASLEPNPGPEDYLSLQSELQTSFQTIFDKCDMEGEAHEQLHAYLFPLMGKMRRLETEEAPQMVEEISSHIDLFDDYFEPRSN